MILISGSAILMAIVIVAVIAVALVLLAVVIFEARRGGRERPGGGAR